MSAVVPVDVPSAAVETGRDTIGGAAAAAASLPERTGGALLESARGAFTEAVVLSAVVSAALAITAAIVTATVLRRDRSTGH
jgi:DHA2 family multidrug resistance protein-like MFS transporter